jgi:hypothetical protein
MNHRLQQEMSHRLYRWQDTLREDAARLRFYQRELANTRQLPARPHASIKLLLRQCAAARKMKRHAASTVISCTRNIRDLSGTFPQ